MRLRCHAIWCNYDGCHNENAQIVVCWRGDWDLFISIWKALICVKQLTWDKKMSTPFNRAQNPWNSCLQKPSSLLIIDLFCPHLLFRSGIGYQLNSDYAIITLRDIIEFLTNTQNCQLWQYWHHRLYYVKTKNPATNVTPVSIESMTSAIWIWCSAIWAIEACVTWHILKFSFVLAPLQYWN